MTIRRACALLVVLFTLGLVERPAVRRRPVQSAR